MPDIMQFVDEGELRQQQALHLFLYFPFSLGLFLWLAEGPKVHFPVVLRQWCLVLYQREEMGLSSRKRAQRIGIHPVLYNKHVKGHVRIFLR